MLSLFFTDRAVADVVMYLCIHLRPVEQGFDSVQGCITPGVTSNTRSMKLFQDMQLDSLVITNNQFTSATELSINESKQRVR